MFRFRNQLLILLLSFFLGAFTVSQVSADDDDVNGLMFSNSMIVFTSYNRAGSTSGYLWLINPNDPPQLTQLTSSSENDKLPIWSLDGSQIFFMRHRPSEESLWVIGADGTGERQILDWASIGSGGFAPLFWYSGDPAGARVYCYQVPGSPDSFRWIYADGLPLKLRTQSSEPKSRSRFLSPQINESSFFKPGCGPKS